MMAASGDGCSSTSTDEGLATHHCLDDCSCHCPSCTSTTCSRDGTIDDDEECDDGVVLPVVTWMLIHMQE